KPYLYYNVYILRTHAQEVHENAIDIGHFAPVHQDPFVRGLKSLEFEWSTKFKEYAAPNQHISYSEFVSRGKFFGIHLFDAFLNLKSIGPSYGEARYKLCFPLFEMKGVILPLII